MPTISKSSSEDIINATLEIMRKKGVQSITTRSLDERLKNSSRLIFAVFQNIDKDI